MRDWNLKPGEPLSLTLTSDIRLGSTDFTNDQIWELALSDSTPPALALQTTYGLRARALRLFPSFTEGEETRIDPATFIKGPVFHRIFTNFIQVAFTPFGDIDVIAEYWVPQAQGLAGRFRLQNSSKSTRHIQFSWVAQLSPTEGQRMAPLVHQATTLLAGQTDGIFPVVFFTGGFNSSTGPYPALTLSLDIPPGSEKQLTWGHAASSELDKSIESARKLAAQNWEAGLTYLEMLNAGSLEIHTGEPDWDAAFMLAQKLALGLYVGPTPNLPHPSFVQTRLPDQGFSLRGDGSDYSPLWNGQTPLEACYLADLTLPAAPHLAKGLLNNFLATQDDTGFADWKPGLAGQRSRLIATPLLANLAWRIYQATEDQQFLENTFAGLLHFVQAWFTPEHDRDGDGLPEWDHPMQANMEDHPIYAHWHEWALGVDISTVENPTLCALLYRECQSLIKIATLLERKETLPAIEALADNLKTAVETAWNETDSFYFDWDRDTHLSMPSEWLGEQVGSGTLVTQRQFSQPVRLQLQIHAPEDARPHPLIFIHGTSSTGNNRIERLGDDDFHWHPGRGRLTGDYIYTAIEKIEVQKLNPDERLSIFTVGATHFYHTNLLPLWAGIPSPEHASLLVENTITNQQLFWRRFGIPTCPKPGEHAEAIQACSTIQLPWNTLIGEGLVQYGYRQVAAELLIRLMSAVIQSLKQDRAFRRTYHADSGHGQGERNALSGLAPLGLFLEVLGVRPISPHRVALAGFNPFPWPVTVKYRGLTVLRQKDKTIVIFPDGQTVTISDPAPRIVSLESQPAR
ncbi:MAG: hypothetical protein AB1894_06670 [Chloroflexota bacterium]